MNIIIARLYVIIPQGFWVWL